MPDTVLGSCNIPVSSADKDSRPRESYIVGERESE